MIALEKPTEKTPMHLLSLKNQAIPAYRTRQQLHNLLTHSRHPQENDRMLPKALSSGI